MSETITDAFIPLTVEMRAKFKKNAKPKTDDSPLSVIYAWYLAHERTLNDAPMEMVELANAHIVKRIIFLKKGLDKREHKPAVQSRIRAQLRWLSRWQVLTSS